MEWNDTYSIGVEKFDNDHKELVGFINQLHDGIKQGTAREKVGGILLDLIDYADYHFKAEERMMVEHKYRGTDEHKKEHNALLLRASEMWDSFEKGDRVLNLELLAFLVKWLTTHIANIDKKFGRFLNYNGVK